MSRVVIAPHAGGLGDHLAYSWLPEYFVRERRVDEVWIADHPPIRNVEAYRLVWGANPFVSGVTSDPPTAGVHTIVHRFLHDAKTERGAIAAVLHGHGFRTGPRWPRIYYQPRRRPEFRDVVLASAASISQPFSPKAFEEFVAHVCRWNGWSPADVVVLRSAHDGEHGALTLPTNPVYHVRSLFEKADLIWSCRAFLTTESGDQSLAAAIRGANPFPAVHALICNHTVNDRVWMHDNVEYYPTGQMRPDYLVYPEPLDVLGEVRV